MTVGLVLSDESGKVLAGPVKGELETLSLAGGSVTLPSMRADDAHLFYGCNDQRSCCLMLRFVDDSGQRHTISCKPTWFDKELDEVPAYYQLGLEFFKDEDRSTIKRLDRIARGKSEKTLSEVLGDFFKRGLVRA